MFRISFLLIGLITPFLKVGNGDLFQDVAEVEELLKKETIMIDKLYTSIQDNQRKLMDVVDPINSEYYMSIKATSSAIQDYSKKTTIMKLVLQGLMAEFKLEQNKTLEILEESFKMLCSKEISLSADIQKELKCRYIDNDSPFLKIGPIKEEEVYLDPRIVIFHDVINDEEIETLKKLALPELNTAAVVIDTKTETEAVTEHRIAKVAWLGENEDKYIKTINRRVEDMTKLTTETAENLQISFYDLGGQYKYHRDFYGNALNDVEEGGSTVFIRLNVSVTPKKGSAAFWYNLLPNGKGDFKTMHGGCPIISGSKWVANLWLHEKGQEFRRPCTLEDGPML